MAGCGRDGHAAISYKIREPGLASKRRLFPERRPTGIMRTSNLYALFLILPLCMQAQAADFKDWTVDCDNVKGCIALGFVSKANQSELDQSGASFIHVERAGGPDGQAIIRLILFEREPQKTVSLRLMADGEPIAGVASERKARIAVQGADYFETEISRQELQPFIAALRKRETLNLATVDGNHKADISLHGAVAALLKMDEIQGRIDTETALIQAGDKPRTAVPDAPPLPVIVPAEVPQGLQANPALASMLRKRLAKEKPHSCGHWDLPAHPDPYHADEAEALDRSRTLVGLFCSRSAYSIDTRFWIVTAANVGKAVPIAFERPGSKGTVYNLGGNAEFDQRTGTLSIYHKRFAAIGIGDSGKYVWTGRSFALVYYAALGRRPDPGAPLVWYAGAPSSYWPVLWRAEVK
jgi:Protein of unknown function (DUF1176)